MKRIAIKTWNVNRYFYDKLIFPMTLTSVYIPVHQSSVFRRKKNRNKIPNAQIPEHQNK